MIDKKIHIVSFDVPYPADYGGVIDVYFRIKALHQLGFKIILHCFDYGRGKQPHLDEITEKTYYYSRQKTLLNVFNKRPFIVSSRRSQELLNRLLEDTSPILFEGIHSTWFLENKEIQNRLTIVRTHNIEHDYYTGLAKKAGFLKRIYFQQEAKKLKKYESILKFSKHIVSIREEDANHFKKYSKSVKVLPASIVSLANSEFIQTENYAIFHGKLSVSENDEAVKWIIENCWGKDKTLLPLIIAGKDPSQELVELIKNNGITLISNPSSEEMNNLISKARVHILVSDQATGIKLKLLVSLQSSGHVLVNSIMVQDTGLSELCTICETSEQFINKLKDFQERELTVEEFEKRQLYLKTHFDTVENCKIFNNF